MPKPINKSELLSASQEAFDKLYQLIESYDTEQQEKNFAGNTMNRNIRDVLAHVHHWHIMFLEWHKVGMKGTKPDMPAKGYTWQELPMLNKRIWKSYQKQSLKEVKKKQKSSFKKVMNVIQSHSQDDLFQKKKFDWTGSTSMGAYLILNTSSHFNWAIKMIKKGMK